MENFYHTHHANNSKKTCPRFINPFLTMLHPLEIPKRDNKDENEEYDDDD